MSKLELWIPCKPTSLNQGFGNVLKVYTDMGLKGHNGFDYYAPDNTIVRAAHDGIVTFAGEDGSGGIGIVIRTNDQFEYKDGYSYFKSVYWHLKPGTLKVTAGNQVKVGQEIARADNTGLSTGSHLHFGLKPVYQGEQEWQWFNAEQENGYKGSIDPTPYMTKFYAEDEVLIISILTKLVILYKNLLENLKGRRF